MYVVNTDFKKIYKINKNVTGNEFKILISYRNIIHDGKIKWPLYLFACNQQKFKKFLA
jgi:hypothetical protein